MDGTLNQHGIFHIYTNERNLHNIIAYNLDI